MAPATHRCHRVPLSEVRGIARAYPTTRQRETVSRRGFGLGGAPHSSSSWLRPSIIAKVEGGQIHRQQPRGQPMLNSPRGGLAWCFCPCTGGGRPLPRASRCSRARGFILSLQTLGLVVSSSSDAKSKALGWCIFVRDRQDLDDEKRIIAVGYQATASAAASGLAT